MTKKIKLENCLEENKMIPLIMMALSLAQKKQQQNAADTARLTESIGNSAPGNEQSFTPQMPTFGGNQATTLLGSETEEERKRRLGLM